MSTCPPARQEAGLESALALRSLSRPCRHVRHKVPVEVVGARGIADSRPGHCVMLATAIQLEATCEAEDPVGLERLRHVLDAHIKRSALRDHAHFVWGEIEVAPMSAEAAPPIDPNSARALPP